MPTRENLHDFAIAIGRNDGVTLIAPHGDTSGSVLTVIGVAVSSDFAASLYEPDQPL